MFEFLQNNQVALAHPAASNGVFSRASPNSVKVDNNSKKLSLSRS
jgi:hypothetical protein